MVRRGRAQALIRLATRSGDLPEDRDDIAEGFPPVGAPDARVLILGSMPGIASLDAGAYYAHPRNAFWPIIATLCGEPEVPPPSARAAVLRAHRIALWDVVLRCRRTGSLDAAIRPGSVEPNDFSDFFARHPALRQVLFNGTAAETLFRRHVLSRLELPAGVGLARLPSTSPANASWSYAHKLEAWRSVLGPLIGH